MRLLLDTHAFIWSFSEPESLSVRARSAIEDVRNEILLSVVSLLEMQIKLQLGKLQLQAGLEEILKSQQTRNGVRILALEPGHIFALSSLPLHHRDPFDRLLVAQALAVDACLVSADPALSQYPARILW